MGPQIILHLCMCVCLLTAINLANFYIVNTIVHTIVLAVIIITSIHKFILYFDFAEEIY